MTRQDMEALFPQFGQIADLSLRQKAEDAMLLAREAGLPDKLVHLIAVHSFEGDRSYQTPESAFVRKLDIFVFENTVAGLQKG